MKYHYFYHTRGNEKRDGWISARNRHGAYVRLRKQGIRPYRMVGGDPVSWKRWTAIAFLLAAVCYLAFSLRRLTVPAMAKDRSPLYGDPATIQRLSADGWRGTFPNEGDAFLARHAVPGMVYDCPDKITTRISIAYLPIVARDPEELRQMKRMVNGMKRELRRHLSEGGTMEEFISHCCVRVCAEKVARDAIYDKFIQLGKEDPAKVTAEWEMQNEALRTLGLPTIPLPQRRMDTEAEADGEETAR